MVHVVRGILVLVQTQAGLELGVQLQSIQSPHRSDGSTSSQRSSVEGNQLGRPSMSYFTGRPQTLSYDPHVSKSTCRFCCRE